MGFQARYRPWIVAISKRRFFACLSQRLFRDNPTTAFDGSSRTNGRPLPSSLSSHRDLWFYRVLATFDFMVGCDSVLILDVPVSAEFRSISILRRVKHQVIEYQAVHRASSLSQALDGLF